MKLSKAQLDDAVNYAGFDFNPTTMEALVPTDDYDQGSPEYELRIKIKLHSDDQFGRVIQQGKHCKPKNLSHIARALADCSKDNFETLHLYVSSGI